MKAAKKKRMLGIDENGLGPLMGPLVITGVLLKQDEKDLWFDDIADSKEFFSRDTNNFSRLEETVVALFYLYNKKEPEVPSDILHSFCGNTGCLSGFNICKGNIPQDFIWADNKGRKKRCEEFLKWKDKKGVEIEKIKSVALCPRRINNFIAKGDHKFLLDLSAFCEVIKGIPDKDNLSVYAGKVGGLKFYRKYLGYYLPEYQCTIIKEKDDISMYQMEGEKESFTIGFYADVESKSFSAALSSLVGKYVRELFMAGIRKTLDISEDISGYHDRKTISYIKNNNFEKFPSDCLFRRL